MKKLKQLIPAVLIISLLVCRQGYPADCIAPPNAGYISDYLFINNDIAKKEEIKNYLLGVQKDFFRILESEGLLGEKKYLCTSAAKLLALFISQLFDLPIGCECPARVEVVPGEYCPGGRVKLFHHWIAIYINNKPVWFIDATYGQFDEEYKNKIIVEPYFVALDKFKLKETRTSFRETIEAINFEKRPMSFEEKLVYIQKHRENSHFKNKFFSIVSAYAKHCEDEGIRKGSLIVFPERIEEKINRIREVLLKEAGYVNRYFRGEPLPLTKGRNVIYAHPTELNRYIVRKFALRKHTVDDLQKEVNNMFRVRKILKDTPVPKSYNYDNYVHQFTGDVSELPEDQALNPQHLYIEYEADEEYLRYANEWGIDYETVLKSAIKNITDMAKLLRNGYVHESFLAISHWTKDRKWKRKWKWNIRPIGHIQPCDLRYGNFRIFGIADFEHIIPLTQKNMRETVGQNFAEFILLFLNASLRNELSENQMLAIVETSLDTFYKEIESSRTLNASIKKSLRKFIKDFKSEFIANPRATYIEAFGSSRLQSLIETVEKLVNSVSDDIEQYCVDKKRLEVVKKDIQSSKRVRFLTVKDDDIEIISEKSLGFLNNVRLVKYKGEEYILKAEPEKKQMYYGLINPIMSQIRLLRYMEETHPELPFPRIKHCIKYKEKKAILFEKIEGRLLEDIPRCSFLEALKITLCVAKVVKQFLDAGIYHWDITPSNIILTHGGRIILIDWDLAFMSRDAFIKRRIWKYGDWEYTGFYRNENYSLSKREVEKKSNKELFSHHEEIAAILMVTKSMIYKEYQRKFEKIFAPAENISLFQKQIRHTFTRNAEKNNWRLMFHSFDTFDQFIEFLKIKTQLLEKSPLMLDDVVLESL